MGKKSANVKKPHDISRVTRFHSFTERIQAVNVDVSRKIERRTEVPEDAETFFGEALEKWRQLNLTVDFAKFQAQVSGCTQTFAQLVHNEKKVVEALLDHLKVHDSLALEPLFDLVVQLARDLRKDFYPYFHNFFKVIVNILNNFLKSSEVLEQAFTCMSYLFKFLWRYMVADIEEVYLLYCPFLSDKYQEYVRRFAAESLSYIMRKIKDQKSLFTFIFSQLCECPEQASGVGNVIFEMVKGAKSHFHSSAENTMSCLLELITPRGIDCIEHLALTSTFQHIASHVGQAHGTIVWTVVQAQIDQGLTMSEKNQERQSILCSSTSLLLSLISYKDGLLLPRPCDDLCTQTMLPLLDLLSVNEAQEQLVSLILECMSSLLLFSNSKLETSVMVKCLNKIYCDTACCQYSSVCEFTSHLLEYSLFDANITERMLQFCSACLTGKEDRLESVLALLSQVVFNKRPISNDGMYQELNQYHLIIKSNRSNISTTLLHILKESTSGEIENIEQLWASLNILPHCTSVDVPSYTELLLLLFDHVTSILLDNKDSEQRLNSLALIACHTLESIIWTGSLLSTNQLNSMIDILRLRSTCPCTLRMTSLYFTYASQSDTLNYLLTDQLFKTVYSLLKTNISHWYSQVRLLSLRILSQFTLNLSHNDDKDTLGVFDICLLAEEQEASLENHREKLKELRKLDSDLVGQHLPLDNSLDDVPLRYLAGSLYVNFSMLWTEAVKLIEGHGSHLPKDVMWTTYGELLSTAAQNCREHRGEVPNSTGDECDPCSPLNDILSSVFDHLKSNSARVDHMNQRELLWKAMLGFTDRCEKNSKLIIPLFMEFLNKEYYIADYYAAPVEDISKHVEDEESGTEAMDTDSEEEVEELDESEVLEEKNSKKSITKAISPARNRKSFPPRNSRKRSMSVSSTTSDGGEKKKRTKLTYSTFLVKLTLLSKFHNPMSVCMEPQLTKLYNDLLLHRDAKVQQVALKCIMSYKRKHLMMYAENFERLLTDSTFKTEIVLFSIDSENTIVKEADRPYVMPLLMRILYGRMLNSTGNNTKGRGARGDLRRTIVISFLAGCKEEELSLLFDLVAEPFKPILGDNIENLSLVETTPARTVLGLISTTQIIIKRLGHLIDSYLGRILHMLTSVARYCVYVLEKHRDEVCLRAINSMKGARQMVISTIAQFMDRFSDYDYSEDQLTDLYTSVVWSQIERLPSEGLHSPTALLKLLETWSTHARYRPMLIKLKSTNCNPLKSVMELLAQPLCKPAVSSLIMELSENLLEEEDELMDPPTALPLGEMVQYETGIPFGASILLPHLDIIMMHISKTVSKTSIKANNQKLFPTRELNILSIISQHVEDSSLCAKLLDQLLPFLCTGARIKEETQVNIVKTVTNLVKRLDTPLNFVNKLTKLFSSVTLRSPRVHLVKTFQGLDEVASGITDLVKFVTGVNAYDSRRIEEPDYDSRLAAFNTVNSMDMNLMSHSMTLAIIHNCCFTIRHVSDMSLRDNASHTLQKLVSSIPRDQYDSFMHNHILPEVRSGIQNKQDVIRSEFIGIFRDVVKTSPDQYPDLVALANPNDIENDFWENIKHIQVPRRLKALKQLQQHVEKTPMRQATLVRYLLPMVNSFMNEDVESSRKSAIVDICIQTTSTLCKHLPWSAYKTQLRTATGLLSKGEKSKMVIRLICAVLEAFHFDLSKSKYRESQTGRLTKDLTAKEDMIKEEEEALEQQVQHVPSIQVLQAAGVQADSDEDEGIEADREQREDSITSPQPNSELSMCPPDLATKIHEHVVTIIIPQLHTILSKKAGHEDQHKFNKKIFPENEEIQRVPLAIAIVKLLQKISQHSLDRHLSSVLVKVCVFLKSRSEDIRETARQTLAKIVTALGVSYFDIVLDEMRGVLSKGYQLHVLCYSAHYLLEKASDILKTGDLDKSLPSLIEIIMFSMFGSISQDRDIDKKSNFIENKKSMSLEMFEIASGLVSAKCIAMLIIPLREKLDTTNKAKEMRKIRDCFNKVAAGLLKNEGISGEQHLKFTYGLISESVSQLTVLQAEEKSGRKRKNVEVVDDRPGARPESALLLPKEPGRAQALPPSMKKSNKHVLVEFGLSLLNFLLKTAKIKLSSHSHAMMIDPFVSHLCTALSSTHVPVIIASLRCLSWVLKYKKLPSLVNSMDKIVGCLFVLLNNYTVTGTTSGENFDLCQLSFRLISMVLKSCDYYQFSESQVEILLTYAEADLMDYSRQASAFATLKAIIARKLTSPVLYEVIKKVEELSIKSEEAHVRLACRQVALQFLLDYPLGKTLHTHVYFFLTNLTYAHEPGRESALEMAATMITSFPQPAMKMMAMHVIGTFAEVESANFKQHVEDLLPVLEQLLNPSRHKSESSDMMLYQVINLLCKVIKECPSILSEHQLINNSLDYVQQHMLHPHAWVRSATAQVFGLVFASYSPEDVIVAALTNKKKKSNPTAYMLSDVRKKLRDFTADFCTQLSSDLIEEEFASQIVRNLVFLVKVIKGLPAPEDTEGEESDKLQSSDKTVSLHWLCRRLGKVATDEATRAPRVVIKRTNVFKCLAAISLELGSELLPQYLSDILPPLHRETNMAVDIPATLDLRNLGSEVMDLLKSTAGLEKFSAIYSSVRQKSAMKKSERKRKQAQEAVVNPSEAAGKKIRLHQKKTQAKKRKIKDQMKINFHSIAELATSSTVENVSPLSLPPQDIQPSTKLNYMRVRMEPSPAQSLQVTPSPPKQTPSSSPNASSRPYTSHSPAASEDSGYGRETEEKAARLSDEDDSQMEEDLTKSDKMRKYRKQRTVFESSQLKALEDMFVMNAYPSSEEYETLASDVSIDEGRLRIWFQNRRARYRRSAKHSPSSPTGYQSMPFHSVPSPFTSSVSHPMMSHNSRIPQSHMLMMRSHPLMYGGPAY